MDRTQMPWMTAAADRSRVQVSKLCMNVNNGLSGRKSAARHLHHRQGYSGGTEKVQKSFPQRWGNLEIQKIGRKLTVTKSWHFLVGRGDGDSQTRKSWNKIFRKSENWPSSQVFLLFWDGGQTQKLGNLATEKLTKWQSPKIYMGGGNGNSGIQKIFDSQVILTSWTFSAPDWDRAFVLFSAIESKEAMEYFLQLLRQNAVTRKHTFWHFSS